MEPSATPPRALPRLSARVALVLLQLGLLLPLLVVFGVALELWLRQELREEFHRELRHEAERLVVPLNRELDASADHGDLARRLEPLLAWSDHPAWVVDRGAVVAGKAPEQPTALPEHVVRPLSGGLSLNVAADVPPSDAVHEFRRAALGALAVTLLLAGGGGYLLASIALRPIGTIARAAEEIDARSLHARLPERPVKDELGRLVETLNHMLARIEQGVVANRRFAEDLSHELKTPLAAIRGSVEVALRERKPADLEWALDVTLRELERLERLVSDLLILVRSEARTLLRRRPAVDLRPVLRETAEIGDMLAQERGGRLEASIGETPLTVDGDPVRLRQVAMNLVDNAVKHGRLGGTVWLRCAHEAGAVVIAVEDDGPGVPPDARERVFERFFRLPSSSEEKGEGLGLGLAIARAVVQEHGGTIGVEERAGGGARFLVRLPATGGEA